MGEFKRRSHEQEKPSVDIVRAAPEDAEAICDIRDRAWLKAYTVDAPDLKITEEDVLLAAKGPDDRFFKNRVEYLKKRLAEDSGQNLWLYVAKIDGKVVGYTDPSLDDRGRRRIGAMYVDPAQQGKGVGGKLIRQALEALGRDQDIYLEVVEYNQNAIGFYEHFGFVKTGNPAPPEEGRPEYLVTFPEIEMVLKAQKKSHVP